MELSLGFLVILILIIFPGLITRRLYFYGEFSKEFKYSYNLITLVAISTIPGLINLIIIFLFYDNLFIPIDLGEIIDKFKDVNNPEYRLSKSDEPPIKELINSKAAPFVAFLYTSSLIFGSISGRLVRISGIDTKFKLLRFNNYWFYLFNGQHTSFKKMKHLKKRNKRHLFTKADVLIDTNNNTYLYSGIVVDYELRSNDNQALSKIMLQNAERYSLKNDKRVPVSIPGNLLIVDCHSMKNVNLTYVYEETKSVLKSKLPTFVQVSLGTIILLLIPIFIFKTEVFNWVGYNKYSDLSWYNKILAYFLTIQVISLFNPFVQKKGTYEYVKWKDIGAKLLWAVVMVILFWALP